MNAVNRVQLDLNLLRVFDAVFRHRGLTAAADELNMSQPAVSHAVSRLRTYYEDPLFRRKKGRMEPTARAVSIAEPIAHAMEQIARTEIAAFNARVAKRTFHAAIVNYAAIHLMPEIMDRLGQEAPNVRMLAHFLNSEEAQEQLQKGDLDVIIGVVPAGGFLQRLTLFRDELVLIACKQSVPFGNVISAKDLSLASHVYLPQLPGIERIAATLGGVRHSMFLAANVGSMPFNVMRSTRIALVPKSAASIFQPYFDLIDVQPPWELSSYVVEMLWSPRMTADAGHTWLRAVVRETASALEKKYYSSLKRIQDRMTHA